MHCRPHIYVLDAHGHPRPERDTLTWARWFESPQGTKERIVRQDKLDNGVFVSTVFLGIDHNFLGVGPPVLWESMIFGGPYAQTQWRYNSKAKALKGHQALVEMALEEWNLDAMLGEMPKIIHADMEDP